MNKQPAELTRFETMSIMGTFGEYLENPKNAQERMKITARNMAMLRRETGLSQKDVCDIVGVAPQTYSGYEKGKHEPTLETIVRLSKLYHVTVDYLVGANEGNRDIEIKEAFENEESNPTLKQLSEMVSNLSREVEDLKNSK